MNKSLVGNIDIAVPVGIRSLFSLVIVTTSEISASPLHGYKDVQHKKKKRFLQVSNYTCIGTFLEKKSRSDTNCLSGCTCNVSKYRTYENHQSSRQGLISVLICIYKAVNGGQVDEPI